MRTLALIALLSLGTAAQAADVSNGWNQGPGGFYNPKDRSGPYAIDGAGNATLIGSGSASSAGITPAISQSGTSLIGKGSQGNLYGAYAQNLTGTAGFMAVVNATSVPTLGATIAPQECVALPASGAAVANYGSGPPDAYATGIVVLISTSCQAYTPSTLSAFIKVRAR